MIAVNQPSPTTPAPELSPICPNGPFTRIIGQRRAVAFLKEIREGVCLGAHPRPLLFLGRSGYGKTALSKAYAESIGADFVRIDCGPELKSEHLVERVTDLKSLAVVFCDEMQSMRKRVQEILYSAIDSSLVPALDRGRLDRCAEQVPIVPFVLIGATNEPGRLLPALRARMVNIVMDEYSDSDLHAIARQKATQFFLQLSNRAIDLVVRASGGSPRTIVQILQSIEVTSASWRFSCEMENTNAELADVDPADAPADGAADDPANELASKAADDPGLDRTGRINSLVGDLLGGVSSQRESPASGAGTAFAASRLPTSVPCIPDELVERALAWMGLDLYGLDATGRTLLTTMAQHGRATAELLSTVLGLDIPYTRQALAELRARQFTQAAPGRGWVLTDIGKGLVKELGLSH
jgi:Holliday junction resolvasome RuvABC ATP-dependent DNA helicase subunit